MNAEEQLSSESPLLPEESGNSDSLTEDLALARLKNGDPSQSEIEDIAKHPEVMKSRKVRLALAAHPHAPRPLALRLIRESYSFDLMHFALLPTMTADLKRLAEELLVARLPSITLGERISLARRSSSRIAAALLLDKESRVWKTALESARLNEVGIVRAVQHAQISPAFVHEVCRHSKWSVRREIRIALLQSAHTPLARAVEFARGIPPAQLRDILYASRLPEKTKDYLRKALANR